MLQSHYMAYDFSKLDTNIEETKAWLMREFSGIRTGRASTVLLENIKPEVYDVRTPLAQIASLSIEDVRTIRIIPWDKTIAKSIDKAISEADLGVSVMTDDQGLRVIFPELTAERRGLLIKLAAERFEHSRVTLRGHRTDAIKDLEAAEKEGGMGADDAKRLKEEIQKKIDAGANTLEALFNKKEEEIKN